MDTLLKTPNKLEFLHPLHGYLEKLSSPACYKLQNQELRFGSKKPHMKWGSCSTRASISALLELVSEVKKEDLDFELPLNDSSKCTMVDLAVVGGGPAGLAVAQQVSEVGLSVCAIDPNPRLIWPNNYGVWVDEFEAMDLLDCLDTTWSGAVVYIDEQSKKNLGRPYGRVVATEKMRQKMSTSFFKKRDLSGVATKIYLKRKTFGKLFNLMKSMVCISENQIRELTRVGKVLGTPHV